MSELEDGLNRILSSPEEMQKIMDMAKNLMGDSMAQPERQQSPLKDSNGAPLPMNIDPKLLRVLSSLNPSDGSDKNKEALIQAMKPFLRAEHRDHLDRAYELTRMIHMARLAMNMMKAGWDDV